MGYFQFFTVKSDAERLCMYHAQSPYAHVGHTFLWHRHIELKMQGPGMWTSSILQEITKNSKAVAAVYIPTRYKEHVRIGHTFAFTMLPDS